MKTICSILFIVLVCTGVHAQQTVGRFQRDTASEDGYVLFAPLTATTTYLIDKCGKQVHSWSNPYKPGIGVYLLKDGTLLRTGAVDNPVFTAGGYGGVIQLLNWDSSVKWSYIISSSTECQHHDVCIMPNGNILAIVWESKTKPEAIAAGRIPAQAGPTIWSEKIVELQPTGTNTANTVWEWHVWDHLIQDHDATKANYDTIFEHPELINLNYNGLTPLNPDWLHINSVAYNPALDQIMLSIHTFDELWVIDHSTTTAQAATHTGGLRGKGGDLLYRWGNPEVYGRDTPGSHALGAQHHAHWIEPGMPDSGKIMVFNNQQGLPGVMYSTVDVIEPPMDAAGNYHIGKDSAFGPFSLHWQYRAPQPYTDFYSRILSGAYRLKSGNTLITSGVTGTIFEVDDAGNIVWKYVNPVLAQPVTQGTAIVGNTLFRASQYPVDFPAFAGKTLTPGAPVELNPVIDSCLMIKPPVTNSIKAQKDISALSAANPFTDALYLKAGAALKDVTLTLKTITGATCSSWQLIGLQAGESLKLDIGTAIPAGVYLLQVSGPGMRRSMLLQHQ